MIADDVAKAEAEEKAFLESSRLAAEKEAAEEKAFLDEVNRKAAAEDLAARNTTQADLDKIKADSLAHDLEYNKPPTTQEAIEEKNKLAERIQSEKDYLAESQKTLNEAEKYKSELRAEGGWTEEEINEEVEDRYDYEELNENITYANEKLIKKENELVTYDKTVTTQTEEYNQKQNEYNQIVNSTTNQ